MPEYRNVKIKPKTHERLKKLGSYEDTMEDIIRRILDHYESKHERK